MGRLRASAALPRCTIMHAVRANGFGSHAVLLAVITSTALLTAQDFDTSTDDVAAVGVRRLAEWLGALPDDSWSEVVAPTSPFLSPPRDSSETREWLVDLATRYWSAVAKSSSSDRTLLVALAQYTGTRLAHDVLRAHHRPTFRYFAGFVRYVSPHVRLTNATNDPRPWVLRFPQTAQEPLRQWVSEPSRQVRALWTLERYLGWPTMQVILARLAQRASADGVTVDALAAASAAAAGRDLSWFFGDAFSSSKTYDYAVSRVGTTAIDAATMRSTVLVERHGEAIFSGLPATASALDGGAALQIVVRFSDDTTLTETWDGRTRSREFTYEGAPHAVAASVDRDRTLLLDADPFNNAVRTDSIDSRIPARWALHWLTWLQDAVLLTAMVL
jgi:hypothetical protein